MPPINRGPQLTNIQSADSYIRIKQKFDAITNEVQSLANRQEATATAQRTSADAINAIRTTPLPGPPGPTGPTGPAGPPGSPWPLLIFNYGAVGDGTTNDAPAFQAAYDDAVAVGGGQIYCPGGFTYSLQGCININSSVPVKFYGDGPSTVIKRGASITAGKGVFDITGGWAAFENLLVDGDVTTPVGLEYSSFSSDPMAAALTTNTSFWVHGGAEQISFFQVYVQHTGGYAILLDADGADILNTSLEECWFVNNRPNLFGTSAMDLNYGSWTGGVFYRGDCRSSASKLFAVRGLSIVGCHWRRNTGNCLWGHSMGFDTHHEGINFVGNDFEDCGLDAILIGNVYGGNVSGNIAHRVGYVTLTDSDTPDPAYLAGVYAVFLDSSGYVDSVNYGPNTVTSVNGDAFNLDGVRNCTMNGLQADIPVSGTPQYTEDSISLYGPAQNGVLSGRGIGMGNTSMNGGGYNVTIMNPKITGFGYSAVLLAFAKNCKLIAPLIVHPTGAAEAPIQLFSDNADPEFYCFGNTIEGATVAYSGAFYAVEETGNGWQATDENRVFDTELIGAPAGEFLPDATTISFSGVTTSQYRLREQAAPAVSAAGQSIVYMDSTTHIAMISEDGGAYQPLAGGGLWAASGSDIHNTNSGAVLVYGQDALPITEYGSMVITGDGSGMVFRLALGYSATNFFAWLQSSQNGVDYTPLSLNAQGGRVVIGTATMPGSPGQRGLYVVGANSQPAGVFTSADGTGYVESTGGFLSTATNSDTVNIPNGGVTALSLIAARNDGASGLTLVRSSATARTWGLGVDASGYLVLRDETAAAARLTVDTAGLFTFGSTVAINQAGAISLTGVLSSTGASGGVNVTTAAAFNAIQVANGGFLGKNLNLTDYVAMASKATPAPISGDSFTGNGLVNYDSSSGTKFFFFRYGTGASTYADSFLHSAGLAATDTNFDSIQTDGGMYANGALTTDQIVAMKTYAASGSLFTPSGGYGALGHKAGAEYWYWNGSAWASVNLSTAGGGVVGSDTQVIFNDGGSAYGADAGLTYVKATDVLTATGGMVSAVFNSTGTGAAITFKNNNNNFSVDGDGNISAVGKLNLLSAGTDYLTFTRTAATARTYAMRINGSGVFEFADNTASAVRLSVSTAGLFTIGSTVAIDQSGNITMSAVLLLNGTGGGVNVSGASGASINYNAIQVSGGGGMYARSFTALTYIQAGTSSGTPSVTAGDTLNNGCLFYDTGTSKLRVKIAGSFVDVQTGSGSVVGADTQVIFNDGGSAYGADAGLTYVKATDVLTATGGMVSAVFNSTGTGAAITFKNNNNNFSVDGNGNVSAVGVVNVVGNAGTSSYTIQRTSATARKYGLAIDSSGTLLLRDETGAATRMSVTTAGLFTWGSTVQIDQSGAISASGVISSTGASGGVNVTSQTAVNSIQTTGGMNVGSGGSANGVYQVAGNTVINASRVSNFVSMQVGGTTVVDSSRNGTFVALTFGGSSAFVQGSTTRIDSSGNGTFAGITSGLVNSSVGTGATLAFQAGSGNFQVYGNGNVNGLNINALTSFQINGASVINSYGVFVGPGVLCGANGIGAGGFNPWNGSGYDTGATGTITLLGLTNITVRGGSVTGWA